MPPSIEKNIYLGFGISSWLLDLAEKSEAATQERRAAIRGITDFNQLKVLQAFRKHEVCEGHFTGTTGYGFHDTGREVLDRVLAEILGAEEALVRWQFVSGTHALSCILFGCLRPGDSFMSLTGPPYDTLLPVIKGGKTWKGSLNEWGISYREAPALPDGRPDLESTLNDISPETRLVYIQRSCGYSPRRSVGLAAMREMIARLKARHPEIIVMVDNCYGEMVEEIEPTQIGADIMGGSLIKNLGGTIAPTGGYIAGRKDLVERAAICLTSPGIGPQEGATLSINRHLLQGLFFAPMVVGQALQGAVFASHLLESLGFEVMPRWMDPRTDIIQAIILGDERRLKVFCRGIQKCSPVDSMAVPIPVMNPGYRDPIIMAGGTFIQGSSLELSADGPLREPYAVYLQGGISYILVKAAVLCAVQELSAEGLLG